MLDQRLEKELYFYYQLGLVKHISFDALPEVAALLDRMLLCDELGLEYSRVVALLLMIDVRVFAFGHLFVSRVEQTQVAS
jgi:hypothetical protein